MHIEQLCTIGQEYRGTRLGEGSTYSLGFKRGYLGFGLQHFTLRNHEGIQDLPSQENASRTEEHAGKVSIVTMQQHPQLWFF